MLLGQVNLQSFTPQVGEENVMQWWKSCSDQLQQIARKGFNSLIILGLWTIWNHKNRCVFDGLSPNLETAIRRNVGAGWCQEFGPPYCLPGIGS